MQSPALPMNLLSRIYAEMRKKTKQFVAVRLMKRFVLLSSGRSQTLSCHQFHGKLSPMKGQRADYRLTVTATSGELRPHRTLWRKCPLNTRMEPYPDHFPSGPPRWIWACAPAPARSHRNPLVPDDHWTEEFKRPSDSREPTTGQRSGHRNGSFLPLRIWAGDFAELPRTVTNPGKNVPDSVRHAVNEWNQM